METEIRRETVLSPEYDALSRPIEQTHIKVGVNVLAIDELVSMIHCTSNIFLHVRILHVV